MECNKIADQLKQNKSEASKYLFRMARQSKENHRDIGGIPCIHDTHENLKVSLGYKMKVWKKYE